MLMFFMCFLLWGRFFLPFFLFLVYLSVCNLRVITPGSYYSFFFPCGEKRKEKKRKIKLAGILFFLHPYVG